LEDLGAPLDSRRLGTWLLLNLVISSNPTRRREYLDVYGSLEGAASAGEDDWSRFGLLRPYGGNDIFAAGPRSAGWTRTWTDRQLESAARIGATILTLDDRRYPEILRAIADPPAILQARGRIESLQGPLVAVVGARRATPYGLTAAGLLARDLADSGVGVVSGGARGIDSAAHKGALEAGGTTIAVLGSGLDVPYPEENAGLFDRIAASGAVISEFPFGTFPQPRFFPYRNRVIAGLSLGTIVVEGARESGSLITAALAAEGGREVFAVPGPITSGLSEGPNRLIQDGAKLVRGVEDILEELPRGAAPAAGNSVSGRSEEIGVGTGESGILEALDPVLGSTADELSASLGLPTGSLLSSLLELELEGKINQLPGGRFARRR